MIFAKLSLSFRFSLTELVIVSANPATQHHPTDTQTSINFLSYSLNMKGKLVYIDVMSSNKSLNTNPINEKAIQLLSYFLINILFLME